MIKIIDCGSQLTRNIARRIRELGVYSEIVPYNTKPKDIFSQDLEGTVISGGQFSVHDEGSPMYSEDVLQTDLPVLGICYGQQSIAYLLKGKVVRSEQREYGDTKIRLVKESPLFKDIPDKEFRVWMSHADIVEDVPNGFQVLALSKSGHIASICRDNIYAVQFHPEVDHTKHGRKILDNFLAICKAERKWNPKQQYERIVKEMKEKTKGKVGVIAISGGVDSTTAAVFLNQISAQIHPIFVDNGLLRSNEAEEVMEKFRQIGLEVQYVDARKQFLDELKGVVDPDKKRKIIGNLFIKVFEKEARKIGNINYLVQGTLYPDVIESIPVYGISSKIKRHHNVGGLPDKMKLELVEPWRNMFKDEVRKIAEEYLNIPKEVVWRHPFPGPGLAVRIIGDVTQGKLQILRKADAIFIDELKNKGLYYQISQAFCVLTNAQSVGVMGDEGTYQANIVLRAVVTNDFMTSDIFHFKWDDLQAITNRIINEVKGVNRVVYDTSQKPPSTIEWE